MHPAISSIRTSTISVRHNRFADQNHPCNSACRPHPFEGLGHLLQDTTIDELLDQPDLDQHQASIIRHAVVDGFFPYSKKDNDDKQFLAGWLVQQKQGKLLSHWLEFTPLTLQVSTKEIAAGLLAIMQSTSSFSGLALQFVTDRETDIAKEVIPLLGQAIQANQSLTSISLFLNDDDADELPALFDILAGIPDLELVIALGAMTPASSECLSKLLSRNKTLRVLELTMLESAFGDGNDQGSAGGSAADVIMHLAGQSKLERLSLSTVPPGCQAVVGELLCTNHVLKELKIGLVGPTVDLALINGFVQTDSVESVQLSMFGLEDGMLPFISIIAAGNTSIKNLEMRSRHTRVGGNDSPNICQLISLSTLASLIWRLPTGSNIDLPQIGRALEKNIRLETLMLIWQQDANSDDSPGWINEASISALAINLQKNFTLTELVLASERRQENEVKENYSVLQQVLDRNNAIQQYACSDGFLCGAAEGFFATVGLPVDTAAGTARTLIEYKPKTGVAALALINKASYVQALFRRQQAHSTMLDHLLPITDDLVVNNRQEMIGLLYRVIVSNGGFSTADLARIADSPTFPCALVAIMFRSPHDFLYLVKVFCQAVGMPRIRSRVTHEIAKDMMLDACKSDGTGNTFILSMLEQCFPPDQKHLAPFVSGELNFDFINSADAKLFIGYDIPVLTDITDISKKNKKELVSWCIENRQPGVLLAFYDASASKMRIDFTRYSGVFARSMIEKIPLLKKSHDLYLYGVPGYEDALVLQRALAGPSILEELYIDGSCCGQEFELIMQGLSLNRRITSLYLNLRVMVDPPAIYETLAGLLEANRKIKCICLQLHDNDPEQPELRQLAAMDDRLELEHVDDTDDPD